VSEQLSASQEDLYYTEFSEPQYPVVHDGRHFPTAMTKKGTLVLDAFTFTLMNLLWENFIDV